jgi:hypothetical protein
MSMITKTMSLKGLSSSSSSPNPNSLKKDCERIENLAIDLKVGFKENRKLGFQVDNEALVEGLNQAEDYKLVKRIQLRAARQLKIVSINYKPYPEYCEILMKTLNEFISAMAEIIVDVYRTGNKMMFNKEKYFPLVDHYVTRATQDLMSELEPISEVINETSYTGL